MKSFKIPRHAVILAVCAILVFGAGLAVHKAWADQVARNQAKAAQAESTKKAEAQQKSDYNNRVRTAVAQECVKETGYWNLLTPVQKRGREAPACTSLNYAD